MGQVVAQVVVARPLPGPLSYAVPEALRESVRIGSAVEVPFRTGSTIGFVAGFTTPDDPSLREVTLKEVRAVLFGRPVFNAGDLEFFQWISDYYQLPMGEVFHSAFPKAIFKIPKRGKKEAAEVDPRLGVRDGRTIGSAESLELTRDQAYAFSEVSAALDLEAFKSFLLFGVTGSGKTEIYIRAARKALEQGRTALILVPEIALTPQLRRRFEERFGSEVAVLHSSLTLKTRRDFWWDILEGRRRLVVGARSALFAPLENIGLIVVDEEHEPSYKQEDRLRYSARDLALVRARKHRAVAILGSATPSVETFHAARNGKHALLTLKNRPEERPMPSIEVVDLREEIAEHRRGASDYLIFGRKMREGMADALARGEQAMVFVNRKGYASFLLCRDCGEVPKCLNCSVSLTYYQRARQLRCHYCGLEMIAPDQCSKCLSTELKLMGMGTELVEEEAKRLFAGAVVERLDAESSGTVKKLEATLDRFRRGESQILVGTQMLAKGHDFPNVTFIGVVLADLNLHLPDFRACERTFQLLAQVAGRAGRGSKPGKVVLQTFLPGHYVIQASAHQDYLEFFDAEIVEREKCGYPPFFRIAQIEFRHLKETHAMDQARKAGQLLNALLEQRQGGELSYLGPAAASVARIANQYRWQILLKSEKSSELNAVIKTLRKEGIRFIDVDPVSTL